MDLSKKSFWQIIDNLNDGIYIVDRQRRIVYWNDAAEHISGYKAEEIVGISCADNILCHVDDRGTHLCTGFCPLAATIAEGTAHKAEVFLHHKDGTRVPVCVCVNPLTDDAGDIIGAVEIFSDLRGKLANEMRLKDLEQMAMLDRLTNLANRHYLERELEVGFEAMKRYGSLFGVLFMDIDNFKNVNDLYGHEVGDRVLQFVAGTISANSRPFDLYGRWGGEEFVGIVRNVTPGDLRPLGERLRSLVGESFILLDDKPLRVTISVGATMVRDTDSIATLIRRADDLMYRSKAAGKNCLTAG